MDNTILIIDDNKDICENTNELLELAGYKTMTASNGKEGLEIAKKNKLSLILCDIMMPELDGYGVLRALENMTEMNGTPFIFMTAKSEKADFRIGMDLGADDYLTKPFSGDDLLKVVAARLKKIELLKKTFENNLEGLNSFISTANMSGDISMLSNNRIVKKIRKKDMIFMDGDSPNYLYFVVSGKIKTFKTNEFGKDFITEIHKDGDFLGYVALLKDTEHGESAMAIEDSEIALIPKQDFFQLLFSNDEVSKKFITFMANNLSSAEEKLLKLAYDSVRKRVAEALLFIVKKCQVGGEKDLTFILNRDIISSLAGTSPESVSRNLTDFKEEGLIETDKGKINILDLRKLELIKN